jgi:hypothetical protein
MYSFFLVTHAQSVHNKTQNLCLSIILSSPPNKKNQSQGETRKKEEAGSTLGF